MQLLDGLTQALVQTNNKKKLPEGRWGEGGLAEEHSSWTIVVWLDEISAANMCFYLRSIRGLAWREVKGIIQLAARKALEVAWRGRVGPQNIRGSILKDQEQINVTALFICGEVLC